LLVAEALERSNGSSWGAFQNTLQRIANHLF